MTVHKKSQIKYLFIYKACPPKIDILETLLVVDLTIKFLISSLKNRIYEQKSWKNSLKSIITWEKKSQNFENPG